MEAAFADKLSQLEDNRPPAHSNRGIGNEAIPPSGESLSVPPVAGSPQDTVSPELNGSFGRARTATGKNGDRRRRQTGDADREVAPHARSGPPEVRQRPTLSRLCAQPLGCPPPEVRARPRPGAQGQRRVYGAALPYASPRPAPARRRAGLVGPSQVDPLLTASALWGQTHPALAAPEASAATPGAAGIGNGTGFYETKPIMRAD